MVSFFLSVQLPRLTGGFERCHEVGIMTMVMMSVCAMLTHTAYPSYCARSMKRCTLCVWIILLLLLYERPFPGSVESASDMGSFGCV